MHTYFLRVDGATRNVRTTMSVFFFVFFLLGTLLLYTHSYTLLYRQM